MNALKASKLKVVLFDAGGVLIVWTDDLSIGEVAKLAGLSLSQVKASVDPLVPGLQAGGITITRLWRKVCEDLGVSFDRRYVELWSETLRRKAKADTEMIMLARKVMEGGLRVGIFSNTDPWHVRVFKERRWFEGFDPWILSFELGVIKPDPDAFCRAEKVLEVEGGEILLIDDRLPNVRSAMKMGWKTIHHTSANATRMMLTELRLIE